MNETVYILTSGGGAAQASASFVQGINDRLQVVFIQGEPSLSYDKIKPKVFITHCRLPKIFNMLFSAARFLYQEKPVYMIVWSKELVLVFLMLRCVPFLARPDIVMYSATMNSAHLATKPRWLKAVLHPLYRCVLPRLMHIISQSQLMADDLVRNFNVKPQKVTVIAPPVSKIYFDRAGRKSDGVENRIVFVGRLAKEKNLPFLLQVMRQLPWVRLTIVGDGPEMKSLQDLSTVLNVSDRVEFAGFQRDPSAYLYQAKAFVLCSHYEGLSVALVEALSCGVPCVCTYAASSGVITDGVNGMLVQDGDVSGFAEAIKKMMLEPFATEMVRGSIQYLHPDESMRRFVKVIGAMKERAL